MELFKRFHLQKSKSQSLVFKILRRVLTAFEQNLFGGKMAPKRHYPKVVIFFGPDGAGKSTQAQRVMKYLSSQGCRTWRTWIRGRHSLAFFLANFLADFGYCQIVDVSGEKRKVFDPRLLPRLAPLWGAVEFVSVLPWILLRVYLPGFLGYTVIAERYIVDTVVYLGYWLGYGYLTSFPAKVLWRFIPEDSVIIHLYADTYMLLERSFDDEVTQDFIEFQQEVYHKVAKKLDAISINTSQFSVEETSQQIFDVLHRHTGSQK